MKLYFVGYKGIGLVSKGIMWRTNGVYSHVGQVVDIQNMRELSSYEAVGGVWYSNPTCHRNGTPYDVFSMEATEKQYTIFNEYKCMQKGMRYDFLGILGFFLNRDLNNFNEWFCSELEAWCCKKAGIDLLNFNTKPPRFVSPTDFLSSNKLKYEFSGLVYDSSLYVKI